MGVFRKYSFSINNEKLITHNKGHGQVQHDTTVASWQLFLPAPVLLKSSLT
jgi:hypothetical protein